MRVKTASQHAGATPLPIGSNPADARRSRMSQRRTRGRTLLAAGTFASLLAAQANAVPIPIINPGFETDFASTGCFQVTSVTGWTAFDPNHILNGSGNAIGVVDVPLGSVWFPGGALEGQQAALVFLADTVGAGPAGLTQVLNETLQPNTTYTLSARIGNIASGTGPPPCNVFGFFNLLNFPGYRVQLLAGGVVVGQDDNSLFGTIPEGEFGLSVTRICIGNSHPRLGQALEIRLINLNTAQTIDNPGIEVDFDDVRLIAEPRPTSDLDADCDVDSNDLSIFAVCFDGPEQPPAGDCAAGAEADLDHDGDADMADFALFSTQVTGQL